MIGVLDANIAIALLVDLPYSAAARDAAARLGSAIAPDLIIHEATTALWRIAGTGKMDVSDCQTVLAQLPLLFDEVVSGAGLAQAALTQAAALGHPAYDCFYSALAASREAALLTADRKFASLLQGRFGVPVIFVE